MTWENLISILIAWNILGAIILVFAHCVKTGGAIDMADGWEFVNPTHVYKYNHVNWFGAIVVSIIYAAICPVGALIYWFYKLCTFGRS